MLVKNVHIHNREGLWQILIEEGKISRIFLKMRFLIIQVRYSMVKKVLFILHS